MIIIAQTDAEKAKQAIIDLRHDMQNWCDCGNLAIYQADLELLLDYTEELIARVEGLEK